MTLYKLLVEAFRKNSTDLVELDCYQGILDEGKVFLSNIKLRVVDLARYDHFDYTAIHAPVISTFFLYGDKKNAYITHIPSRNLDFLQVSYTSILTSTCPRSFRCLKGATNRKYRLKVSQPPTRAKQYGFPRRPFCCSWKLL